MLSLAIHLAPDRMAGIEFPSVCPKATDGCRKACFGGNQSAVGGFRFSRVKAAQIARTVRFWQNRKGFLLALRGELHQHQYHVDSLNAEQEPGEDPWLAACRPNTLSDILWERLLDMEGEFPRMKFYDYTKHSLKTRKNIPSNYHLVYSISEQPGSWAEARRWLDSGRNASMVVGRRGSSRELDHKAVVAELVAEGEVLGYPCIDGDIDDLRFYDGSGKIVLLYPKGRHASNDRSGFVKLC